MKSKKPYSNENRGSSGLPKQAASHRTTRVEGEMREVIATFLLLVLGRDLPGMVTVTRIIVSKDLRNAKVLFTVMDPTGASGLDQAALNKATLEVLKGSAYEIQAEVNSKLKMRYTPILTFFHDDGFENAMKVENILNEISKKRTATPAGSSEGSGEGSDT